MNRIISICIAAILAASFNASADNPLGFLKDIVSNVTATDKFEIADLAGTWQYESPAISFKSDDALSQIGGVAASATIEEKLAPYYEKLKLDKAVLTFDAEGNFTIKINKITLKGTVTKDSDGGLLTFNFNANGKFSLGKVAAKATKSATGELALTFDASRIISIVKTVATYANNSSLNTVSSLLDQYEGIYAGAKLKKCK